MKILNTLNSFVAAAFVMLATGASAQNYTDIFGGYNYKGNLKVHDTTFLQRLVAGDIALDSSALAQFNSTTKGILVPRLTAGQIDSIAHPANGLLVYNITVGCFFYYNNSAWVNMCSSGGGLTSPGSTLAQTSSAWYNISDSDHTGLVIGQIPPGVGTNLVDTTPTTSTFIGVGDFTPTIGTANTAAMMGSVMATDNNAGIAVQPDSAGTFKVVALSNLGQQRAAFIIDSSLFVVFATDSQQQSLLQVNPGSIGFGHRDSASGVENSINAVSTGIDMQLHGKTVSFNAFPDTLQNDMVFKTDAYNNVVIDYLHSTKDSFSVAGKLQVQDGTEGPGKVLTSDITGVGTWQNPNTFSWGLHGNSATTPSLHYIGTSDNNGLAFKTDNVTFGYVDSLQQFNFSTKMDSAVMGLMTTHNGGGIGLEGIFLGDETNNFGFYQFDATRFGLSKHMVLIGDTFNNHMLVDDSIVQLQSSKLVDIKSARGITLEANKNIAFNSPVVSLSNNGGVSAENNISDSSVFSGAVMDGNSSMDGNNLSGGMQLSLNTILGGGSSISGNNFVGHGHINGIYPGMAENFITGNSHIDSNYLEGETLMWNLSGGADNSSFSNNYLKNLSAQVNIQDVHGQFYENVVGDTVTGDNAGIWSVALLGRDSIAFNNLSGTSSGIRNVLMQYSNLNNCNFNMDNAGVVASQFYNSDISHITNQVHNSTFFNVCKDFTGDTTPWNNVMLINDNVGIGITSKPTANFQIGDYSKTQSLRYVDGNQGLGKVLTSDGDGNATWQTPSGGGASGWGLTGNTGAGTGADYIGTADNNGLAFKTNGVTFGYIDSLQMFNFSTGMDSDIYGIQTTNNVGGEGAHGMFAGNQAAGVGYYTFDGTPFELSKHVCLVGDFDHSHILRDDSLVAIGSAGDVQVEARQGIHFESDNAPFTISAPMITEFDTYILPDSIADSSNVYGNMIANGAAFGSNTLSGGATINANHLFDGGSSCTGNILVGHGYYDGQGAEITSNEMHAGSHLDSNYLEGEAKIWGVGKHSAYSNFSRNYLKNFTDQVQLYGISGESGEHVVWDTITGDDHSGIFNLSLMSFDSVAYNVLSGANTNINNLIMQNSDLNYCHFTSPNTQFNFSQLFNSHITNDTVSVVNCFFHNVNKDFKTESDMWSNIMLLNDNVGIGIVSKPTAGLQVGDNVTPRTFRYVDGNQGSGKILASDLYGNAQWQDIATIPGAGHYDSTVLFTPGATDTLAPGDTVILSDTVAIAPYKYNIIDSTGALTDLTIALPLSPAEGEWVEVKLVQSGVSVHYINGAVANSAPAYIDPSNLYIKLVFRAAKNTWY